jgi:accessory gene regulator B
VILIEKLAHNLAARIALQLDYDENKKAVIAYGFIAILQIATIFIISSIIGVLFDFWYESVIIFLGVGIMRKSTGGAHASTMNGCIVISVLSIAILSMISRYLLCLPINFYLNIVISLIVFIICFIIFYLRVPIDSPNKPIIKPEKIMRLRKQSFIKLTVCFIISIIFILFTRYQERFYSIAVSIRLAMLWQLLTLTKTGSYILKKIDSYITSVIHE